MAITREDIVKRIALIDEDIMRAKQQIILLDGARQDAEFWLAQLTEEPARPIGELLQD